MSTTDELVKIKYTGSALPGNAEVVTIFNTYSSGWAQNAFQMMGIRRVVVEVNNDQSGTLNMYKSSNGTTWVKVDTAAVSAAAANSTNINDYFVEPYGWWKLEWVNGATPQTAFDVNINGTGQRNIAN